MASEETSSEGYRDLVEATHLGEAARTGILVCPRVGGAGLHSPGYADGHTRQEPGQNLICRTTGVSPSMARYTISRATERKSQSARPH